MSRVGEASTMSVPQMRDLLGIKKTDSYWLLKKKPFATVIVDKKIRIVISSFEEWYANQVHYHKVNGPEPGAALKKESYSAQDVGKLLGICKDQALVVIKQYNLPHTVHQNGQWRVDVASFESWYASQSHYRNTADRERDRDAEARSVTIPEFARSIGISRNEAYKLIKSLKGQLETIIVGDKKRITLSSIDRWRSRQQASEMPTAMQNVLQAQQSFEQESEEPQNTIIQESEPTRPVLPDKSVFSVSEAATILDYPEKTLYRLIDTGDLKGVRIRNYWRIQRAELQRWIDEQEIQPAGGGMTNGDDHHS